MYALTGVEDNAALPGYVSNTHAAGTPLTASYSGRSGFNTRIMALTETRVCA